MVVPRIGVNARVHMTSYAMDTKPVTNKGKRSAGFPGDLSGPEARPPGPCSVACIRSAWDMLKQIAALMKLAATPTQLVARKPSHSMRTTAVRTAPVRAPRILARYKKLKLERLSFH